MKAILFTRVSTQIQHLDEQENRIKTLAIADGYKEEDLIPVSFKESGIRLSEENRLGITEMKSLILNNPDIKAVYAFEVSRLARRKDVLFSVVKFLQERAIQLVIYTPSIRMLNPDGSVSDAAEMVFTIFAQLAESEMRIKMERFKQGKDRLRKQGKFTGATLPLGYKVDDQQYVVIDEETAPVVRAAFEMYSTGEWSTNTLSAELTAQGMPISQSVLAKTLGKRTYLGETGYPRLISDEVFDACKEIRKNSKVARKTNYPSAYLCNRLIVCPECGYHFSASNTTYRCFKFHEDRKKKVPNPVCNNGTNISIKLMDNIVWYIARQLEVRRLEGKTKDDVKDLRQQQEVAKNKLANVQKAFAQLPSRKEKALDMYESSLITKETLMERVGKIDKKADSLRAEEDALNADIQRLTRMIENIQNPYDFVGLLTRLYDDLPVDAKQRREIVRSHIAKITLSDWQYIYSAFLITPFKSVTRQKKYMIIEIFDVRGNVYRYRFFPRWSFGKHLVQEETEEDGVKGWDDTPF